MSNFMSLMKFHQVMEAQTRIKNWHCCMICVLLRIAVVYFTSRRPKIYAGRCDEVLCALYQKEV